MDKIKDLKIDNNTVVHCETEELAKQVLKIADDLGYCWCDKEKYLLNTYWFRYCQNTCYWLEAGQFSPLNFYEYEKTVYGTNYKIIKAQEFIDLHKTEYEKLMYKINRNEPIDEFVGNIPGVNTPDTDAHKEHIDNVVEDWKEKSKLVTISGNDYHKHLLNAYIDKAQRDMLTEMEERDKHRLKGYKESTGKLFYELDWEFITQLAERMSQNKVKYEKWNWKKPINIEGLQQATLRHLIEVLKGNYTDEGRDFGHLESIAINAMILNYQLKNNSTTELK